MTPTFPYWRDSREHQWTVPPDGGNPMLAELNSRPMPSGVQVEVLFGSGRPTLTGVTAHGAPSVGPGDGFVAAASAQGLPIQVGNGVAALLTPNVVQVDLGTVGHIWLLPAAMVDRFTASLLQRIDDGAAASPRGSQGQ
jgi:hypothetical protein